MKPRKILNTILSGSNYGLYRKGRIDMQYIEPLIDRMTKKFIERNGDSILHGPFTSLKLPMFDNDLHSWSSFDHVAKLVGCYEMEIHDAIMETVNRRPDIIINIGCADGYYAVGVKKILPNSRVEAYDIEPMFGPVVAHLSKLNGVHVGFSEKSFFDNHSYLTEADRILILCDCEGAEVELEKIPYNILQKSDLIIEMHPEFVKDVKERMILLFEKTHEVSIIQSQGRNPSAIDEFRGTFGTFEQFMLLCEFRSNGMEWLYAKREVS